MESSRTGGAGLISISLIIVCIVMLIRLRKPPDTPRHMETHMETKVDSPAGGPAQTR